MIQFIKTLLKDPKFLTALGDVVSLIISAVVAQSVPQYADLIHAIMLASQPLWLAIIGAIVTAQAQIAKLNLQFADLNIKLAERNK